MKSRNTCSSASSRGKPCERALYLVLDSQGLTFTRRDHVIVIADPERLPPYVQMETRDYRGDVISLDFPGTGFDEVMALFESASGLEVRADERFSDSLTLKLTDVRWDHALDIVLPLHGLDFEVEDDVIRIGER